MSQLGFAFDTIREQDGYFNDFKGFFVGGVKKAHLKRVAVGFECSKIKTFEEICLNAAETRGAIFYSANAGNNSGNAICSP